ncbi:hypothetical protein OG21DRAFT_1484417 [Imleria badia]|nr:hypothetical protein OG21DRAFT_1484417 [Imleria badia]
MATFQIPPLIRDDLKPLQMHQYKVIAISSMIHTLSNPRLRTLLTTIDARRGPEHEEALQRAFGVDIRLLENHDDAGALKKGTMAFMTLGEAVDGAMSWVWIGIQCLGTT